MSTTIGIIGVGEIASAIVEGACAGDDHPNFFLSPRNAERSAALAAKFNRVEVCESNQVVVDRSELVILAVLPQQTEAVLAELDLPLIARSSARSRESPPRHCPHCCRRSPPSLASSRCRLCVSAEASPRCSPLARRSRSSSTFSAAPSLPRLRRSSVPFRPRPRRCRPARLPPDDRRLASGAGMGPERC